MAAGATIVRRNPHAAAVMTRRPASAMGNAKALLASLAHSPQESRHGRAGLMIDTPEASQKQTETMLIELTTPFPVPAV